MADNPLPKPSIPAPPPAPQQKSSGQGVSVPKPPGTLPPKSSQPGETPTAPATPQVPRPPVVSQKTGVSAPSTTSQPKSPTPGQSQSQQVFSAPSAAQKPSTSSFVAPASTKPSHPTQPQQQSVSPPPQTTQSSQSSPNPGSPKPPVSPPAGSPTPPKLKPTTSGVSVPSPTSSAPAPKPTASVADSSKSPVTPGASSPANSAAGSLTTPAPTVARPPSGLSAHSSMTSTNIAKTSPPPVAAPPPAGQVAGKTTSPTNTATKTTNSASTGTPAQPAQPTFAKSGFSLSKKVIGLVIAGLALLGIIGVAAWFLLGSGGSSTDTATTGNTGSTENTGGAPARQVSIEYWGLWEPTEVMQEVFTDFQRQNPGVVINYRKQSAQDYRTRLQTAIAGGNGPDVFRFHASWVPMLSEELAPLPNSVMSSTEYQKTFYPVATYQLQHNSQIVGIPLMYDGLALYYNKSIFETADIKPPQTWSELQSNAVRLTVRQNNRIQRAGIAMGNAANTEHFSDIIGLLMLQNGADFNKPNSAETRDALLFYVNFVKQLNVWDSTLPSSTVAFAREEAAMMIAPSWRAFEVDQVNPNLEYGIAPLPQLPDATRFSWGTYWAEGVNSKGSNKEMAWKLLKYMSSPEVLKKLHAEQAKTRSFGEIYPRVDMAEELAGNEKIRPFLQDAPYAQSWYINSYTHDAGLNDQLIKYYEDAVNALLQGDDVEDVLETLDAGTQQVARQYSGN